MSNVVNREHHGHQLIPFPKLHSSTNLHMQLVTLSGAPLQCHFLKVITSVLLSSRLRACILFNDCFRAQIVRLSPVEQPNSLCHEAVI